MAQPYDALILSPEEQDKLWNQLGDALLCYRQRVASMPVSPTVDPAYLRQALREFSFELPLEPRMITEKVLDWMNRYQLHTAHPGYFGVFNPNPSTMGIVADAIVAAFNPQLATAVSSPIGVLIEEHLLNFFGKKFNYADGAIEGTFATGGTEANHTAVLVALNEKFPEFGRKGVRGLSGLPTIYCSTETHHSILKAAKACGLGLEAVREISVREDLQFDLGALTEKIAQDRAAGFLPFLLIGTCGSTSAGMIDDLSGLQQIAREHQLWFHVDGAWGGAVSFLEEFAETTEVCGQADSITLDAHKWLSVPMGAGIYLSKHVGALGRSFATVDSPYMPVKRKDLPVPVPYEQSLQWSRRFIGLKVFMTLAVAGEEGYASAIRHQVEVGAYLRAQLREHDWEVLNETRLPVACFRDRQERVKDLEGFAKNVADTGEAWITTTVLTNGAGKVLRAGIPNLASEKEDVDHLIELLGTLRKSIG